MISGVRQRIATAVAAVLDPDDSTVRGYGVNLDAVEHPTVLVLVDSVEPPSVACPSDVAHVDVILVVPQREAGPADDALDALFDLVAPALDQVAAAYRGTAERVTYLESWPAYRIPVEVRT